MAAIQPLTLQDVQDAIEVNVNNDVSTPGTTDDEWSIRLNLIKRAIGVWEGVDGVFWDELWTTYTHASTITTATSYALTVTDMRFTASQLRLTKSGTTYTYPIISPEKVQNYDVGSKVAYLTGNNKDGWTLNLRWTPATGDSEYGAAIAFDYYKYAYKPVNTTDKFEMSDPEFIIWWASAQKALLESQNSKYSVFIGEAQRVLEQMKVMNTIRQTEADDVNEDLDAINDFAILGE